MANGNNGSNGGNGGKMKNFLWDPGWIRIAIVIGSIGIFVYETGQRTAQTVEYQADKLEEVKKSVVDCTKTFDQKITKLQNEGCDPAKVNSTAIAVQDTRTEYFMRQQAQTEAKVDKILEEIRELSGK